MQTVLYDGSFEGWLSAVFDVYNYKFTDVQLCTEATFKGNIFDKVHASCNNEQHSQRVWQGLEKRLPMEALQQLYQAFLSETEGMETILLHYVQYVFSRTDSIAMDYSHPAVLKVIQTARKVWREQHRMEAFVRFQKTADGIYFATIAPGHNVLPLIAPHFETRYADQSWVIYDVRRKYGIYFNLQKVEQITIDFDPSTQEGKDLASIADENEMIYQQLWQRYFKSVNIAARRNTRLHVQHMPRRYWKFLTEKRCN